MVDLLKGKNNHTIPGYPDKLTPKQEEALLARPGIRFAKKRPDSWYNVSRSTDLGDLVAYFDVSYDRSNCEVDEISMTSLRLNDVLIDERCMLESVIDSLYMQMEEELAEDPRY